MPKPRESHRWAQGVPGTRTRLAPRVAGPYPSVCHTLTPGTVTGKVGSRLWTLLRYHNHHGQRGRGSGASSPPGHLGSAAPPALAAPAAPHSRSPLRNASSDSRTPSRVVRRVCSLRRTAPNFTRVLPRCRSRQVVHNAPQTRNSGRRKHKDDRFPPPPRQNLGQGTKPRHLEPTRRLPLYQPPTSHQSVRN